MLTLIPTPLGNLQDITYRALEIFPKIELFLCEDTRVSKRLIQLLHERMGMELPKAEYISFHEHNSMNRLSEIGDRLKRENVAYLSDAGMPAISDPGQTLVEYCQKHSIEYDVLPGASAVTTAYAASGFSKGKFLFYGFLPHKGSQRREALGEILREKSDVVLYESPHRLIKLIDSLIELAPDRELFLAKEISKKYQHYYRGDALSIKEQIGLEPKGEWVVIIEGNNEDKQALYIDDIFNLELPPKVKAKLLAKLSKESVSYWYNKLSK